MGMMKISASFPHGHKCRWLRMKD